MLKLLRKFIRRWVKFFIITKQQVAQKKNQNNLNFYG